MAAEPGRIPRRRTAAGLVLLLAGLGVVAAGGGGHRQPGTRHRGAGRARGDRSVVALGRPRGTGHPAGHRPLAAWRSVAGALAGRSASGHPRRTTAAATALMIGVASSPCSRCSPPRCGGRGQRASASLPATSRSHPAGPGPGRESQDTTCPRRRGGPAAGVRTVSGLATGQAQVGGRSGPSPRSPATIGQVLDLHSTAGSTARSAAPGSPCPRSRPPRRAGAWAAPSRWCCRMARARRSALRIFTQTGTSSGLCPAARAVGAALTQLAGSAMFVKLAPAAATGGPAGHTRAGPAMASRHPRPRRVRRQRGQGGEHRAGHRLRPAGAGHRDRRLRIADTLSLSVYERTREIGCCARWADPAAAMEMVRLDSLPRLGVRHGQRALVGGFGGWALAEAGPAPRA